MTVPIFKLSNQIEPLYLEYSSHTDGHNSRYVDTTAILRTGGASAVAQEGDGLDHLAESAGVRPRHGENNDIPTSQED